MLLIREIQGKNHGDTIFNCYIGKDQLVLVRNSAESGGGTTTFMDPTYG